MLSRAFAGHAGAYVVSVAGLRLMEHVPDRYRSLAAKIDCDKAGHYSRPDLFELKGGGRTVFGRPQAG